MANKDEESNKRLSEIEESLKSLKDKFSKWQNKLEKWKTVLFVVVPVLLGFLGISGYGIYGVATKVAENEVEKKYLLRS